MKNTIESARNYLLSKGLKGFANHTEVPNWMVEYANSVRPEVVLPSYRDCWTACTRIKADKGHLLNKSTEWQNAYQEGFEDCFKWLNENLNFIEPK